MSRLWPSLLALALAATVCAAAGAAKPLSDFGLTEPVLERYGFQDTAAGLKDTVRNALYTGADRDKVLAQIQAWEQRQREDGQAQRRQDAAAQTAVQAAVAPAAQAAQGADAQAAVYDGQASALDAGDAAIQAWKARQKAAELSPAAPHESQAVAVPEPAPQVPTAAPFGLQGRGTAEKIIGLVMQSLPGPDLADVARRLAQKTTGARASASSLPALCRAASQSCLNELLAQYYGEKRAEVSPGGRTGSWFVDDSNSVFVKYGDGKKAPGEFLNAEDRLGEAEAQKLIELGFRRGLGLGEAAVVRVIFAPGSGLSKNRGVWLSNPVLRRKDGSFDLVFSESVLAAASSRDVDLTGPLKAVVPAERRRILNDVLAGEDPIALGNRLNCLLLGWMQAETLRAVEQGVASGESAQQARGEAQNAVLADPLKSRLYAIANNTQNKTRWDSFFDHDGMEGLDQAAHEGTSDLWKMLGQANAGDPQAAAAFLAALAKKKGAIARAQAAEKGAEESLQKAQADFDNAPDAMRLKSLNDKMVRASYASEAAEDALWKAQQSKADATAAQAAFDRARAELQTAQDEFSAAQQALEPKLEALRGKVDAADQAVYRAQDGIVQARLNWERAGGYLDYYEGEIPEKAAKDLELPADFKARQLRRRVLAGDKDATRRFAADSVAAEDAAARAGPQGDQATWDPAAPKPPSLRKLGPQDEQFLDAFLPAVYARPDLRPDYRAIIMAIAQAKGQRLYDALLDRDNSFWPKFFALVPADEAAGLYEKAPEPVRAKMRTVAALCSPPLRDFLDKIKAGSVSESDAQEERLLERASRLTKQFSVLDAAGQKVESRYNAYPMMIMEYLQEPDVLGPILEASRRTGMDPYLISAVAFQEGYNVFAEAVEKGEGTGRTYYFHSMVGPMGLDTFPGTVDEMKRRGWIRPDFKDYRITVKPLWGDYGDAEFTGPEPAETALEAMVGLIRKKRAQFLGDAGRLNIRAAGLSRQDMELWTYLYFNFTTPKQILAKYGTSWVWRPSKPGQDVYNVKRVGATAEWLRQLRFFDGFWAPEKPGH